MNKRMISCTLAILMLLMSMAVPVLAAEEAQKVEVPVEVTFEGTPASADTVTIQLTAQTEGAPLPEGGSDGVYRRRSMAPVPSLWSWSLQRLASTPIPSNSCPGLILRRPMTRRSIS